MAVYNFSALADGQSLAFNPGADVLRFDQAIIQAADLTVVQESTSTRVAFGTKDVLLLNTSPLQLTSSNVTFASGSALLFGDNTAGTLNDNANNALAGTAQNDSINGFGGNDQINMARGTGASNGADRIDGGAGFDTIYYQELAASGIVANFATGTITGGGTGGAGSATFVNVERIIGTSFSDHLIGSAAGQNLSGANGNDTLESAGGVDTLWGGGGADAFVYRETGSANADQIGDFVSGTDKIVLDGTVLAALGASGNFAAGDARFFAAADATGGADASDRVIFNTTTRQIFYDPDGNGAQAGQLIATLQAGATLVATDVEVINGTPPNGVVVNGTEGSDLLATGPGNDTLNGFGGNDQFNLFTPDGQYGSDVIAGGAGIDSVFFFNNDMIAVQAHSAITVNLAAGTLTGGGAGGSGSATLSGIESVRGAQFNDSMTGSAAAETLSGESGDDSLDGGGGNDTIFGNFGNDRVAGGDGDDDVIGGIGVDQLIGGAGNDRLNGLHDDDGLPEPIVSSTGTALAGDVLDGGLGDDTYIVQANDIVLADPGGLDTVEAWNTSWTLAASFENLSLMGNGGGFTGRGNTLANALIGGTNIDSLIGDSGNDTLTGNAGGDFFLFAETGAANADLITDFASGADKLLLDGSVMTALGANGNFAAGDARFFAAAGATGGADASDRVVYNTTTRQVFYDPDGNGAQAGQLIATLQPGATLDATDIIVQGSTGGGGQTITGTAGHDSIVGTAGNDTIDGLAGNDTITGAAGDDSMLGGAGHDRFIMSPGTDTTYGFDFIDGGADLDQVSFAGVGRSGVTADLAAGTISGGGEGGSGSATILNIEFFVGTAFSDSVIGSDADNGLDGEAGNDHLMGGAGNDTLNGGDGIDAMHGGEGNDLLSGGDGNDNLAGNPGNDTLSGGAGNDTLTLVTTFFADESRSWGNDAFDGGAGIDFLSFSIEGVNTTEAAVVDLAAGAYQVAAFSGTLVNIENIQGSDAADRITGNAASNLLDGRGGDDTLNGGAGSDTLLLGEHYVFDQDPGAANADLIIRGEAGEPSFTSGTEKLHLDARVMTALGTGGNFAAGDARFFAGAGATGGADASDRVIYNTTTGELFYDADGNGAQAGQLVVRLEGAPTLAAADIVVDNGSALPPPAGNTITGTSANDTLTGTAGDDTIQALAGNDQVNMSAGGTASYGNDSIDGGLGFDSINFGNGLAQSAVVVNFATGTITGGGSGGAGSATFVNVERVIGGSFSDQMTGNAAGQNLTGVGGNDTLSGAGGIDTLWGGAGSDTFVYREAGTANADRIGDFGPGADKIALDDAFFTAIGGLGNFTAGDARFRAGAGATTGADANDRVIYNISTGQIFYDADGGGAGGSVLVATLDNLAALAATDIVVI